MTIAQSVAAQQQGGIYLPRPPDDREKYKYFGKPRRWAFAWLVVASAGVLYGYVHVAEHAWLVEPIMWLLLMVMVPPVVVNFWLRIGRPRLTLAEHQATVAGGELQGETVDVFLPSCGEPLAVLDNTFRYVSRMAWSGPKTVYVLDDSARDQVRALAARYDFTYIVRPNPGEMKKAGNLTHALTVSTGRVHRRHRCRFRGAPGIPVRDHALLCRCPGRHRADSAVLRRQQPIVLLYPAVRGHPPGDLLPVYPAGQGPLPAAICAGTNLVYRRSAVTAAGGFAQVPIGEDVHSGVKLAWAGYETRYLPLCLAMGVAPTDFPSLANQQARWCRSSMLLMVDKHFVEAHSPGSSGQPSGQRSSITCRRPRCCLPGRSRR